MESKENLIKKILAIMTEVKPIKKGGLNKYQNYSYVREVDVVEEIRELLIKHKVVMIPSMVSSRISPQLAGKQLITDVMINYIIIDQESGESLTTTWCGQGTDTGDKGVYKAITGANKYCLLKTFCIGTEDDPELDDRIPEKTSKKSADKKKAEQDARINKMKMVEDITILESDLIKVLPDTVPNLRMKALECMELLDADVNKLRKYHKALLNQKNK